MNAFEQELHQRGRLVYTTRGVSMRPLLRQSQDLVIIETTDKAYQKYDVVLFKRDNGQYVLHRILKVLDKKYIIVGDNCRQKELVRDDQILGVLTLIIRNDKEIKTNDPLYMLYVHLWCDLFPVRAFFIRLREITHSVARKVLPEPIKQSIRQRRQDHEQ